MPLTLGLGQWCFPELLEKHTASTELANTFLMKVVWLYLLFGIMWLQLWLLWGLNRGVLLWIYCRDLFCHIDY